MLRIIPKVLILTVLFSVLIIISCDNQESTNHDLVNEQESKNDSVITAEVDTIDKALLKLISGIYHGVQDEYNMKNKFGDDVLIAGKSVTVPSTDYKIIIGEDKSIEVQQTSLADNSRYYMSGIYTVVSQQDSIFELSCHLTDEPKSNIEYTLKVNVLTFNAKCSGLNQPDFEVKREKLP